MPKQPDYNREGPVKISVLLDSETNRLLNMEVFKVNVLENNGKIVLTKQSLINAILTAYYKERKKTLIDELKQYNENGRRTS